MDNQIIGMHERLVAAVERARGGGLDQPVTVAEIYQDLVPYRTVRDDLGLELNADYEHLLLRLLSGEGGLVRLEPETARRELEEELASPNPFVGLYRKFAACDVWIEGGEATPGADGAEDPEPWLSAAVSDLFSAPEPEPPAAAAVAPTPAPAAEPEDEVEAAPFEWPVDPAEPYAEEEVPEEEEAAVEEAATMRDDGRGAGPAAEPAPPLPIEGPVFARVAEEDLARGTAAAPAQAASEAGSCAYCRTPLPTGRQVRFCPFCGEDQTRRPCGNCGERLEPEWRYCISCGAGIAQPDAAPGIA